MTLFDRIENLAVIILLAISVIWASSQIIRLENKVMLLEKDNISLHRSVDFLILSQKEDVVKK